MDIINVHKIIIIKSRNIFKSLRTYRPFLLSRIICYATRYVCYGQCPKTGSVHILIHYLGNVNIININSVILYPSWICISHIANVLWIKHESLKTWCTLTRRKVDTNSLSHDVLVKQKTKKNKNQIILIRSKLFTRTR